MPRSWALRRSTIRTPIFVGFALTFGLWLAAGYTFTSRLRELENSTAAIDARYTRAQDLLTLARSQILSSAVFVRDALLDRDPTADASYRERMDSAYRAADEALQQYVPVLNVPEERGRVAQLRRNIGEFRAMMETVLAADARERPADAGSLLRSEVTPRREAAIRIAEDLQALNRRAYVDNQARTAALYRTMQGQVWEILGMVLAVGVGIAGLAIVYAGTLERDLRHEQARDAQLTRDLQRLSAKLTTAQEEERAVIARELHDDVGQLLTAIKMELAMAERALPAELGAPEAFRSVRAIADGAMQRVRDMSRLLHPPLLDDLGLAMALDCHVKAFARRHNVEISFATDVMERRLTAEAELCAFRIVQEALTNVAKHSGASNCHVSVQHIRDGLVVRVEDDGAGFDAGREPGGTAGLGLIGIRERVLQLGGKLDIYSKAGFGTRITVLLPTAVGQSDVDPGPSATTALAPLATPQVMTNG